MNHAESGALNRIAKTKRLLAMSVPNLSTAGKPVNEKRYNHYNFWIPNYRGIC
jgi:hypothetical protein